MTTDAGPLTAQHTVLAMLSILIPCHRVIGSNGKLTGYAGGLKRKQKLLDLEHAALTRVLAPTLW
jgi:methylated-DNA-[protein]-cysteine S-methyltransferase